MGTSFLNLKESLYSGLEINLLRLHQSLKSLTNRVDRRLKPRHQKRSFVRDQIRVSRWAKVGIKGHFNQARPADGPVYAGPGETNESRWTYFFAQTAANLALHERAPLLTWKFDSIGAKPGAATDQTSDLAVVDIFNDGYMLVARHPVIEVRLGHRRWEE